MGLILVRVTYWFGAIIDALAGVLLLLPESVTVLGFGGLRFPGPSGLPALTAAVLMFGFSAVLIWAQMAAVERRAVLLITLVVIVALTTVNVVAGLTGTQTWEQLCAPLCMQVVLVILFFVSFVIASRQWARSRPTSATGG